MRPGCSKTSTATIFAPTNQVFVDALNAYPNLVSGQSNGTGNDDSDSVAISEQFMNILQYHVVPSAAIYPSEINHYPGSFYSSACNGLVKNPYQDGDGVKVFSQEKRISNVVAAGIKYDNRVIHTVDTFLLYLDGPATAAHGMGFLHFYGALQQTDLVTDPNTTDPITVFVPTDQAFIDVGSVIKDLSQQELSRMMKFHVTLSSETWTTRLDIQVDESNGALYIANARVTTPNILLRNGVAHLIDQVLNVEELDRGYGWFYDLNADNGVGVPAFENAAFATIPSLTPGISTPMSTFSPTATFSAVSGAEDLVKPRSLTLLGLLSAAFLAIA